MRNIPQCITSVFHQWSLEFSETVWLRFRVLLLAAVAGTGRRTISRLLRVAGALAEGHWSSYHRVISKRRWSAWRLAYILTQHLLTVWMPRGVVRLVGDDTVTEHRGKKVFGKGCHRDAVHSTHSQLVFRWGHKWVVLSVLIQFPGTKRPWALPILCALYRTPEEDERLGRRHKTPSDLMRQLLCVLIRWFPRRKFVFAGDGGYGTHAFARFARRYEQHVTLVSRFYPNANLNAPPPKRRPGTNGRPRKKGRKLPGPAQVVARTKKRQRVRASWYGGKTRLIEVITGTGHWYRMGEGLVEVRWVYVHDVSGTHRDEYFFTTDLTLSPKQIVEFFTGRWAIEVTFEESREHLGFGTTRGWSQQTVLRAEPCLLGLYSLVALWWASLPAPEARRPIIVWIGKQMPTFSDALIHVRRHVWITWVFQQPGKRRVFQKLTTHEKLLLLNALTLAA